LKKISGDKEDFLSLAQYYNKFLRRVENSGSFSPLKICVERENGNNYIFETPVFEKGCSPEGCFLAERIVKTALWSAGGYKIYIEGRNELVSRLSLEYSPRGRRAFDCEFMSKVYDKPFEIVSVDEEHFPKAKATAVAHTGNTEGCRIGFDAGGSDRKVCAVQNGRVVYSEEVVWYPKVATDYRYHINEITSAMLTARSKLPKLDAIGVSTAGICVDNKIKASSLFVSVPDRDKAEHLENVYIDIAKDFGVPLVVANDGDVAALSGVTDGRGGRLLALALGTSEAAGYIDGSGGITGMLNELAFVPFAFGENLAVDAWSGDVGCGAGYLCQEGVIRLAPLLGIEFDEKLSPAQKLAYVQGALDKGDERAQKIFMRLGEYLAHALAWYSLFYDFDRVLLLGRVVNGKAGTLIAGTAAETLNYDFPHLHIRLELPQDDGARRLSQCYTAASLPRIVKA